MPKKKYPFGEKNLKDLLLLGANEEYKAEMNGISREFGIPDDYADIDGKETLEFMQDPKAMEFIKVAIGFMKKYNLEAIWGLLIAFLAEKGHFTELAKGGKVDISKDDIKELLISSSGIKFVDKADNYVTVRIYKGATSKDMQKLLPEIQKAFNGKTRKSNVSKNIERDLKILHLKEKGKKAFEIAEIINKDPKYKKISYQDVPNLAKNIKRRADKNVIKKDS